MRFRTKEMLSLWITWFPPKTPNLPSGQPNSCGWESPKTNRPSVRRSTEKGTFLTN